MRFANAVAALMVALAVRGDEPLMPELRRRSVPSAVIEQYAHRGRSMQSVAQQMYGYFDRLRLSNSSDLIVESPPDGSSIYQVTVPGNVTLKDANDSASTAVTMRQDGSTMKYRLAELKAFLALTSNGVVREGVGNDAFTALLAVHHFNTGQLIATLPNDGNQTVDVSNCNIKLTMEILDSTDSPVNTTRTFTQVLRRTTSFRQPPTTAVVGADRSSVTTPLAILTGVNHIPQVSHASTSSELDAKEQFPLFGRTVPNTLGEASAALRYFQSHNVQSTHVAILFVEDTYASALHKNFQDMATLWGIATESVSLPSDFQVGDGSVRAAMKKLNATKFRHVYAICYEDHLVALAEAAVDAGLVGPDYFWLFPGLDMGIVTQSNLLKVSADSAMAKLFDGAGILQMQGGVTTDSIFINSEAAQVATPTRNFLDRSSGFARFQESWDNMSQNDLFAGYVRSKLPLFLDDKVGFDRDAVQFQIAAGGFGAFLYDAVVSLGISMCQAGQAAAFFEGPDINTHFRKLDYAGASGRLLINRVTGTRAFETTPFVMWNGRLRNRDAGGSLGEFLIVPASHFQDDEWKPAGNNEFRFFNDTLTVPNALPPYKIDYNYIGDGARGIGYALMGVTMASAIVSLLWLFVYRKEHVVTAAQPVFLLSTSVAAIIMASTIIPLGMEEPTVDHSSGLDVACMSAPWLYVIGSMLALSPMIAKIVGIHQAYMNPDLDFIMVSTADILTTFGFFFFLNFVVLIVWTFVSPLEWTRTNSSATDEFGRYVSSYGQCESSHATAFVSVVVTMDMLILILGNLGAYQARNIETEYNESRYIGISMAATLQAWCMGIPIMIVVWDNPQGRYFVETGIIFITAQIILSVIYVPKMMYLRDAQKQTKVAEDPKRLAYAAALTRRKSSRKNLTCSEEPIQSHQSPDDDDDGSVDSLDITRGDLDDRLAEDSNPQDASPMVDFVRRMNASTTNLYGSAETAPANDEDESSHKDDIVPLRAGGLGLMTGGAVNSAALDPQTRQNGIKITHNPRTKQNLKLGRGFEMSKTQLDYFREESSASHDDTNVDYGGRSDSAKVQRSRNGENIDRLHQSVAANLHHVFEDDDSDDDDGRERLDRSGVGQRSRKAGSGRSLRELSSTKSKSMKF